MLFDGFCQVYPQVWGTSTEGVPRLLVTIALAFYLPAAPVLGQGH